MFAPYSPIALTNPVLTNVDLNTDYAPQNAIDGSYDNHKYTKS